MKLFLLTLSILISSFLINANQSHTPDNFNQDCRKHGFKGLVKTAHEKSIDVSGILLNDVCGISHHPEDLLSIYYYKFNPQRDLIEKGTFYMHLGKKVLTPDFLDDFPFDTINMYTPDGKRLEKKYKSGNLLRELTYYYNNGRFKNKISEQYIFNYRKDNSIRSIESHIGSIDTTDEGYEKLLKGKKISAKHIQYRLKFEKSTYDSYGNQLTHYSDEKTGIIEKQNSEFTYNDYGQLTKEKTSYYRNNKLQNKYTETYIYDGNCHLTQHSFSREQFNVKENRNVIDSFTLIYQYEYDKDNNWVKRKTFQSNLEQKLLAYKRKYRSEFKLCYGEKHPLFDFILEKNLAEITTREIEYY
ncbi:MAG: hypothetical protein HRT68_06000 [Flavobacteriaceae bacterium]|nr:hypothetical protein [Flavobacteriaceae bacterium]